MAAFNRQLSVKSGSSLSVAVGLDHCSAQYFAFVDLAFCSFLVKEDLGSAPDIAVQDLLFMLVGAMATARENAEYHL